MRNLLVGCRGAPAHPERLPSDRSARGGPVYRIVRISFLALLGLAACEAPPAEKPAAAARLLRLHPGVLDAFELQGGEERAWLLDLAAGRYAELVVDQQGIDVAVRLRAPDGRIVAAVDSNNGILGPEPLPVVAEPGGPYRLEVLSAPGVPAGRAVLRLDALRPATAQDRARVEAERALAASEGLRLRGDPASLRAAIVQEREVLARFRALGARDREAETLFCLGRSHAGLGEAEASAGFYREALALYRSLGDRPQEAVTLANLGFWESVRGRPEPALALYRQALTLHRRAGNRPEEARTLQNIARAAMDLGESGEALAAFEPALALWRALGNRGEEGLTLSNLGQLEMDLGQPGRALQHCEQALRLLEAAGDRPRAAVALARIAVARALTRRPRGEVLAAFQQALRLQREMGDAQNEAVTLHNLGWYHHRQGDLAEAQRIFRETLAVFQARGERASEARALLNLGGIDLELGRAAPAEERFARALALLREIGDPGQESTALLGLARARRRQGRTDEALAAVDAAFARIETLRRKPAAPDLRMTFFATRQDVYELRIDLLMELHRRSPGEGYAERALAASEETRARTLLDLLATADIRTAGTGAVLSSQEIRRQVVEKDTMLLEYSLGEERSFLWAVTPEALESFELPPRRELEEDARRAAALLASSARTLARTPAGLALADLSRRLLGPVAHRLRSGNRLLIVPDGALWAVSFAALPDPATGEPLVAGHEIVTLPSASVLPRLREAEGRPAVPGRVAVLADPAFSAGGLERLPHSRAEAEAILSLVPREESFAALGSAASRETVRSGKLARYRIVHFATHALLDTERPERSGIALRDGFLSLAEIYRLRLPADLVVLSACQTALGREIRGEGLVGLTRGFFAAGARQVLVSLWPVDDRATAELMRRFYGEMLGRGRPPAAALREAQTAMWRDGSHRAPYEWAGFILQGDWRVLTNKPEPAGEDLSNRTP